MVVWAAAAVGVAELAAVAAAAVALAFQETADTAAHAAAGSMAAACTAAGVAACTSDAAVEACTAAAAVLEGQSPLAEAGLLITRTQWRRVPNERTARPFLLASESRTQDCQPASAVLSV